MKWYDSDPEGYEVPPLVYYDGTKYDRDPTTFRNFKDAKKAAIKNVEQELKDVKKKLNILKNMTVKTCEKEENPFY